MAILLLSSSTLYAKHCLEFCRPTGDLVVLSSMKSYPDVCQCCPALAAPVQACKGLHGRRICPIPTRSEHWRFCLYAASAHA